MKQMSFLPEPKYNPRMPSENSLAFKALSLLLRGRKVSHPAFEALTGSWRLAAHVHILKRLGWPIKVDKLEFEGELQEGRDRYMGLYYLPEDCLEIVYNSATR